MSDEQRGSLRDSEEIEALRTDRYLDALLAAADRGAEDAPVAAELDPVTRRAIRRLRRDLVRVHPSFRFEERLAARLAAAAGSGPLPVDRVAPPRAALHDRLTRAHPLHELARRRPILVRGAVASAALSIAGAAFVVARRRARPAATTARVVGVADRRSAGRRSERRTARARRAPLA